MITALKILISYSEATEVTVIQWFDGNCGVGQRMTPGPLEWYHPAGLTAELERIGIGKALVYHFFAKEASPQIGNQRLMEEIIPQSPSLHPCWVLLPEGTKEMEPIEQIVARMSEARVGAARMFPVFQADSAI